MKERLLLFDNEIDKLKNSGWSYEIFYEDKDEGIYLVEADVPEEIMQQIDNDRG